MTIKTKTTLDLIAHATATILLCLWMPEKWVWFVIGGVLVDTDHAIDFLLWGEPLNFMDFFTGKFLESGNVYLFFHDWILALIISWFNPYLGTAMLIHLCIDQVSKRNPLALFLIYRWSEGWKVSEILPERRQVKWK